MARPSNRNERRREILDAFRQVMAERGYAGATIAEVARVAGLRQGLVHYHFESKLAILLALLDELARGIEARTAARFSGHSPKEALAAFIDAHVAPGEDADPSAVACWVTIGIEAVRQPEVRGAYAEAVGAELQRLELLVSSCLLDRGRPTDQAPVIGAAIYAGIQGAYQLSTTVPELVPRGFSAPSLHALAARLIDGR